MTSIVGKNSKMPSWVNSIPSTTEIWNGNYTADEMNSPRVYPTFPTILCHLCTMLIRMISATMLTMVSMKDKKIRPIGSRKWDGMTMTETGTTRSGITDEFFEDVRYSEEFYCEICYGIFKDPN